MADASDGHVLGEEDKIESSESHTTQNEDDDISSRVDNPQDQVESSSLNGTGGGPATPAEEHPDAAGDDDDDEHSGQCLPGKDSSDMHGEASEEAREDDIEANTEEHEASGNLKEAEGKGTEEPSRGLAEDGASTGGELDNSRDDQEEEDEVLQIEEPSKQTRDEESEPVKQNVEDVVPQDSPVTAETSQDAEENKISTETLVEDSVGSVESEKGLQGPRTPATPLQDETNEDEKVCDNEDAPQLEAEAPELEQETPIHQLEEEAEEISSAAEKDTSSPTKMEQEDGDDTNQVEKISIDAADTSVDVEEPSREAEQEVMEVDDSSNEPTASTEKETVDDVSKDVEMEDDSQDREEEDKREQQDTSEKSPEPPVLDPENIANDQASDDKKEDDADGEKEEVSETALQNEGTIDGDKKDASSDESAKTDDQQKSEKQTESSKEEHKSNKKADEEDDDVMVIEDDKTEPEAIVLDDDDDDDANKSPEKSKDAQKTGASLATMDSSNDMGLQISSVTSGADASGLHIASVSGAGGQQDKDSGSKATSKEAPKPTQTKVKQEKVTPPSTPIPATTRKPAQTGSTPTGGSTAKKGNKMQSCIVCGKVGRCKYNIVRNGDIKHLCDDVCFRKFRANPTMFLKNTAASQQKSPAQPTTRSQTGSLKPPPPKINSQPDYKTCTVCQLMNINTQKPFVVWMNTDFCSEACLSKYQGNLNSSCSYCTSFVPPTARATHCLQVGTEFKTFCSSKCNTEFKKRLRLCAFCQKDLSTVSDSFCAPVEPNKFRDFCSKVCLKKYEEKSSDVEIIGVESTGKKSQAHKCAVCSKVVPIKHNVKLNGVLNRLCSDPCLSAFQYANKLAMNTCDNCGGLCPAEEIVSHFIQFEGQQKRFCRDACVNAFRAKHRKIVPCAWCGSKKTNFDMIERVDSNNKYQLFCSLNCLSLYRVNLQAKSNQAVTCDHCRKFVPAQYHLTMSDASVRNFCSYNCVMSFQSQFTANTKNSSQPTIHSQQRVQLQNKPSTTSRGTAAASQPQQSQSQQNSFPIISNVVSLAPQGQKQQTVNIKSSTPVPVVVSQGGKQSVSTSTQQQIIIQPPPPKQMKNKSLLCKPFVQTKATSCRPHTLHKEVQTDEHEGKPVLIPVPVPIYIPCPLAMYAYPTPQMVPIPIPIPVPIFIPTARKTADKILKHIKEIQEKIPSDPLEAELLMMAEAVAGGGGGSDSDSDKDEAEPFPPITNDKAESMEVEPVIDRGPSDGGEEDLVQMALRMAEEITGPVLDLETSVEPMAVNTGTNIM